VQGWLQAGEDRKTLVFADNLTEMRALEAAFADRGIGVRVMHSEQGDAANRTAESDYKENPDVRALVSVGMIGEGFNAKHTGCVVVANGCPTRAGYAQMIGRATRVDGVRSDGIVLDFSAATRVWGRMEEQIELQDRHERLRRHPEGLRGRVELEAVIERPEPGLPLIGFAARDATVFAVEQGNGNLQLWQRRRMSGRDTARQGNKTRFERLGLEGVPADQPQSLAAFRRFVDQELTDNAGWHARARRRDAAGDVPAQTMVGRDYADYRDLLATSARAELAKREESVGRVGCVATPANRAATLVSAARGVVEGGPADAVETVAEAVKERAHALPREGRAETAYLAGVLAGELANGVTGSARTRLRGIHAALAVDQGRQGMRAVERRSSQELRRTCANLGATLENVAATMTQSGAAEVGRAAAVWGARCRAAAEAVKARPPRDPVKTE
jgi:superfamily II DNA/RNA helicase